MKLPTSQNKSLTSIIANLKGENHELAEEIYKYISESESIASAQELELSRKIPELIEKLKQLQLSDDAIYSIICATAEIAETKSRSEILNKLTEAEIEHWKEFLATKPNLYQELASLEFLSKKLLGKGFDELIYTNILLALKSFNDDLEIELRAFEKSKTINEDKLFSAALSRMLSTLKVPGELSAAILLQKNGAQTIKIEPSQLRIVSELPRNDARDNYDKVEDGPEVSGPPRSVAPNSPNVLHSDKWFDDDNEESDQVASAPADSEGDHSAEFSTSLQEAYKATVVESVRQLKAEPLIPNIDEAWTIKNFIDPQGDQQVKMPIEQAISLVPKPEDFENFDYSLAMLEHNATAFTAIYGADREGKPLVQNLMKALVTSNPDLMGAIGSAIQILSPNQKNEGLDKAVYAVVAQAAVVQLGDLKNAKRFIEIVQKGGDLNEVGFKKVLNSAIARASVEGSGVKDNDLKKSTLSALKGLFDKKTAPDGILDVSAPLQIRAAERSATLDTWTGENGPFLGLATMVKGKEGNENLAGQNIAKAISRLATDAKDPAFVIARSLKLFKELDKAGADEEAVGQHVWAFKDEILTGIGDKATTVSNLDAILYYGTLKIDPANIAKELRYNSYVQLFNKMLEGVETDEKASSNRTIKRVRNLLVGGDFELRERAINEMLNTILVGVVAPSLAKEADPALRQKKADQLKATLIAQEIASRAINGNPDLIDEAASGNLELPRSLLSGDANNDFLREYAQVDKFKDSKGPIKGDYNERAKNWLNEVKATTNQEDSAAATKATESQEKPPEKGKDGKEKIGEKAAAETEFTARALFNAVANRIDGEKQVGTIINQENGKLGVEETVAVIKMMDARNPALKTPRAFWERVKESFSTEETRNSFLKKVALASVFAAVSVAATATGASAIAAAVIGVSIVASTVKSSMDIVKRYQTIESSKKIEYIGKNLLALAGGIGISAAFGVFPATEWWQIGTQLLGKTLLPAMVAEGYAVAGSDRYQEGFTAVLKQVEEYDKRVLEYVEKKATRQELELMAEVLKIPDEQLKDTTNEIAAQVIEARNKLQAEMINRPNYIEKVHEVEQTLRNLDDVISSIPEMKELPGKIFTSLGEQSTLIRQKEGEAYDLIKAQGIGLMLLPGIDIGSSFFRGEMRLPNIFGETSSSTPANSEAQFNTRLEQANFAETIRASSYVTQGGQNVVGVDLNGDGALDLVQIPGNEANSSGSLVINSETPTITEALRAHFAITNGVDHGAVGVYPISNSINVNGFHGQFAITDGTGNLLEIIGERANGELVSISPAEMLDSLQPTLPEYDRVSGLTPEIVVGQFVGEENSRITLIYEDPAVNNSQLLNQFASDGAIHTGEHVVAAMDILDGSQHGERIQISNSEITQFEAIGIADMSGSGVLIPEETAFQAGSNVAAFLAASAALLGLAHADNIPLPPIPSKTEAKSGENKTKDGEKPKAEKKEQSETKSESSGKGEKSNVPNPKSAETSQETKTPTEAAQRESRRKRPELQERLRKLEERIKVGRGEGIALTPELAKNDKEIYKAELIGKFIDETEHGLSGLEAIKETFAFGSDTFVIDPVGANSEIGSIPTNDPAQRNRVQITIGALPLPTTSLIYRTERFQPDEQVFKMAHEVGHALSVLMKYEGAIATKPRNIEIVKLYELMKDGRRQNNHGFSPHGYQSVYKAKGVEAQAEEDLVHLITLYTISPDYLKEYLRMLTSTEPEDIAYKTANQITDISRVMGMDNDKVLNYVFDAIDEGFKAIKFTPK